MSSRKINNRVKGFMLPLLAAQALIDVDSEARNTVWNRNSGARISRKGKIKAKVRARRARDSKRGK